MNEAVIYKHAMVIWDRDDKESLGGKNIQVSFVVCARPLPIASVKRSCGLTALFGSSAKWR